VGVPFAGSFEFNSDWITSAQHLTFPGGLVSRRHYGAVRDYSVTFDTPGADYVYTPPLEHTDVIPDTPLGAWFVTVSPDSEGVGVNFANYASGWFGRPPGSPIEAIAPDQYIDGLYPHASFFSVFDRTAPLDVIDSVLEPSVDLDRLFDEQGDVNFSLRFTDPFDSDWSSGVEALTAVIHTTVTDLRVIPIPESSSAILLTLAISVALLSRRSTI
jgi:hypothetical protein